MSKPFFAGYAVDDVSDRLVGGVGWPPIVECIGSVDCAPYVWSIGSLGWLPNVGCIASVVWLPYIGSIGVDRGDTVVMSPNGNSSYSIRKRELSSGASTVYTTSAELLSTTKLPESKPHNFFFIPPPVMTTLLLSQMLYSSKTSYVNKIPWKVFRLQHALISLCC